MSYIIGLGSAGANIVRSIKNRIRDEIVEIEKISSYEESGCKSIVEEKILKYCSGNSNDQYIIVGGIGGQFTSKAIIETAQFLKNKKSFYYVILPFTFEGETRDKNAKYSLNYLQRLGVDIKIYDNQKEIQKIDWSVSVDEFMNKVNEDFLEVLKKLGEKK
jgi:cell division GTPase FtsZ